MKAEQKDPLTELKELLNQPRFKDTDLEANIVWAMKKKNLTRDEAIAYCLEHFKSLKFM